MKSNISGPFPEEPGEGGFEGTEESASNTSGEIIMSSNLDFSVSVSSEPFFGGADDSFTSESLGVDEFLPNELFESNHLTDFFINFKVFLIHKSHW